MTFYSLSYDVNTGIGLSVNVIDIADEDANLSESSSEGQYALLTFPESLVVDDYKVSLSDLDTYGLPRYIIERYTGYAYNHNFERVLSGDVEAEEKPEPSDVESYIVDRGIILGDKSVFESDAGSIIDLDEDEQAEYENEVVSHLSKISDDLHVLVNIGLSAGTGENKWKQDLATGKFVCVLTNDTFSQSTVLCLLSINRNAVLSDIEWETFDGRLVFTTDVLPVNDIKIRAFFFETRDEWSARGVIEAWPAETVVKRFCQSRQNNNSDVWPISLSAHGTEGDTKLFATSVDFTNAKLLYATPEYTGNPYVIIPQVYVDESINSRVLVYRVTNLSDSSVIIGNDSGSDVILRLCFTGSVSGFVE